MTQLENVKLQKCHRKEVQISWSRPNVNGHIGFLIRKATVECEDGTCCQHANYDESFEADNVWPNLVFYF